MARWLRHPGERFTALFPYLPRQSGYNKRLRALAGTINWLIGGTGPGYQRVDR